jgi:hypothetical protein
LRQHPFKAVLTHGVREREMGRCHFGGGRGNALGPPPTLMASSSETA